MRFWARAAAAAWVMAAFPAVAAEKKSKISKQDQQLYAMTPEQFHALVTIRDDALETVATITTENGFQHKDGLLRLVNSDHFFRAFVDKKTGQTTYQVYKFVRYYGSGWVFLQQVNYETANGPVAKELKVLGRDVGECSQMLGCLHKETVAWEVDEPLIRWVAGRYALGQAANTMWTFRLKGQSGAQADYQFAAAEAAGLLLAVDAYKRAHGLSKSDPASNTGMASTQ